MTEIDNGSERKELLGKSEAIIFGTAVGDALGMPVEGWRPEQIAELLGTVDHLMSTSEVRDRVTHHPKYNSEDAPTKYLQRERDAGRWTDDTFLTLAVARGLISGHGYDLTEIALKHMKMTADFDASDWNTFGGTTKVAIKNLLNGASPLESGVGEEWAQGNGPAIKAAPIGFWAYKMKTYHEGLRFARKVGQITHLNPAPVTSGIVQTHAVYSLLAGTSRGEFLESCLDVSAKAERELGGNTFTDNLRKVVENKDASELDVYGLIGNSFGAKESVPFALFMFYKYWNNHLEGIKRAVGMGGDSDSIGVIYGALAGASGFRFPQEWENQLHKKSLLAEVSRHLAA